MGQSGAITDAPRDPKRLSRERVPPIPFGAGEAEHQPIAGSIQAQHRNT